MIFVFYFAFFVILSGRNGGATSSYIAVNPERLRLIKDALGWMTFRKNGVLMEERDVESLFLDALVQKYTTSKFYRTFVIAFHQGVLPGLILQEGDSCDPDYTFQYKDPFNSSVTWHYQKEFIFKSYDDRMSGQGGQYCDYRQGLKCISSTRKCECPEGSKMQLISPTSQLQRCLMEKDETCAVIDIDHGNDPSHSALASNLHHLIFNLEKPLSCRDGTQCRFKVSNRNYPLCYDNNNGPWFPDKPGLSFELGLGDECAIDLYASPGSCKVKGTFEIGVVQGYVCYNFGPPRSIKYQNPGAENRTGFCFFEWGIYGLTDSTNLWTDLFFRPYFIGFVYPRTVPLRGFQLEDFYKRYISWITNSFTSFGTLHIEKEKEDSKCNVGKTQKMEQAWKYFASLEEDPLPGEDYVKAATKTELYANIETVRNEVVNRTDLKRKICKVYWSFYDHYYPVPSLTCVANNSVDADGNDGTCQSSYTKTKELAQKIERFRKTTASIVIINEEASYNREIMLLQNPELTCLPSVGQPPVLSFRQQGQTNDLEPLKGSSCPNGSVCYQDFSDALGIYDDNCNIKSHVRLPHVCHNTTQSLEKCEDQYLQSKVEQAMGYDGEIKKLQRGQPCSYNFEMALENGDTRTLNKYELLSWIEWGRCDGTSIILHCTVNGICDCVYPHQCPEPEPEPPESESSGRSMIQHHDEPIIALAIIAITSGIIKIL